MPKKSRKLVRRLTIKIFQPDGLSHVTRIVRAPAGKHFPEHGVDGVLDEIAEEIERRAPGVEYRLVEIGDKGCFNFVPVLKGAASA